MALMTDYRKKIEQFKAERDLGQQELLKKEASLVEALDTETKLEVLLTVARKAAGLVQDELATKLSTIVTRALATIFEEPWEFVAEFVERRNVSECDLYLKKDGEKYDILRSTGGGAADVCSICLQMAFILLTDARRILIIDEPARHLGAYTERFAQVLSQLCTELQFTIIAVTHAEGLSDAAAKVFKVTQKGGVSDVRVNDQRD